MTLTATEGEVDTMKFLSRMIIILSLAHFHSNWLTDLSRPMLADFLYSTLSTVYCTSGRIAMRHELHTVSLRYCLCLGLKEHIICLA